MSIHSDIYDQAYDEWQKEKARLASDLEASRAVTCALQTEIRNLKAKLKEVTELYDLRCDQVTDMALKEEEQGKRIKTLENNYFTLLDHCHRKDKTIKERGEEIERLRLTMEVSA